MREKYSKKNGKQKSKCCEFFASDELSPLLWEKRIFAGPEKVIQTNLMKVFYFGDSNYGMSRLKSRLETSINSDYVEVLFFPLKDMIYFEDFEEEKMIIIDLSPWDELLFPYVINPLKILEKSGCLVKTKVFVILGSKPTPKVEATLATCPLIQGMYVVGGDQEVFYDFLVQEITGNKITKDYASLKGMAVEVPCLFPLSLRKFNQDYAILATHNSIEWSKVEVQDSLFDYFSIKEISLRDGKKKSSSFEYKFSMPLQRHKNPLKAGEISVDQFEGHINKNMEHFLQNQNDVALIGGGEYFKRVASLLDFECNSHITHYQDLSNLHQELIDLRPELIFIALDQSESDEADPEKGFDIKQCELLFTEIKKISFYEPIVLIFNSESNSEGLQLLHDYPKVMGFMEEPKRSFILQLIEKYRKSTQREITLSNLIYPRPDHAYSAGWICSSIMLHELSESEISFSYQGEIVLGSWLRLEFPFPLSLYVFEEGASNAGAGFRLYRARPMGLFGKDENLLRVFINLAFEDPQEFVKYYVKHPSFLEDYFKKHLEGQGLPNEEDLQEKKRVEQVYQEKLAQAQKEAEAKAKAEAEAEPETSCEEESL